MKVLFSVRNDGADAYFRAIAPASVLRYNGYDVDARVMRLGDEDEFDVLVLQRHCDADAELMTRLFHSKGKPVIYDCDDWLFGLVPSMEAYGFYYNRGYASARAPLIFHERLLRMADLVTVSTHELANRLREYNPNVKVLPNCVLWSDWDLVPQLERELDGPVIGWMGLPSHWDDWMAIKGALERAVLDLNAYLVILGFPEVVGGFSTKLAARTYVQPMVAWKQFSAMRQMIKTFDVALAWLNDTPFNRCKSPLRALQYGAAGVPVVASKTVYGDPLFGKDNPGKFALVVDNVGALYYAIRSAIEHKEPTRLRTQAWQHEVWQSYTYEQTWRRWLDVLENVKAR